MKPKLYFPSLNGVRFLAALLVVIDHSEQFKGHFGFKSMWSEEVSGHLGAVGVTVFFALSGFLITYLLLIERSTSGTIDVGHFYIRRVLRIWPIYYLLVLLGFFVLPHVDLMAIPNYAEPVAQGFFGKLALFVFLLPNVAFVLLPTVPYANVLWSVGVEEQFYAFWPWFVKRVRYPVAVAMFVFFAVKAVALVIPDKTLAVLLFRTRFSCLLIGAAAAYLVFHRRGLAEKVLFHPLAQLIAWAGMALMVVRPPPFPYPFSVLQHELIAALAATLILNLSFNARTLISLETPLLDYLGKRSYGIYVYHLLAVTACLRLSGEFYSEQGIAFYAWSVSADLLVLVLSVVLAALSYRFVEQRFLAKKTRYSVVSSGDLAHADLKSPALSVPDAS